MPLWRNANAPRRSLIAVVPASVLSRSVTATVSQVDRIEANSRFSSDDSAMSNPAAVALGPAAWLAPAHDSPSHSTERAGGTAPSASFRTLPFPSTLPSSPIRALEEVWPSNSSPAAAHASPPPSTQPSPSFTPSLLPTPHSALPTPSTSSGATCVSASAASTPSLSPPLLGLHSTVASLRRSPALEWPSPSREGAAQASPPRLDEQEDEHDDDKSLSASKLRRLRCWTRLRASARWAIEWLRTEEDAADAADHMAARLIPAYSPGGSVLPIASGFRPAKPLRPAVLLLVVPLLVLLFWLLTGVIPIVSSFQR